MREFRDLILPLYGMGWVTCIPLFADEKRPRLKGWTDYAKRPVSAEEVEQWRLNFGGCGIGHAFGYLKVVGVDSDRLNPDSADKAFAIVEEVCGTTPLVRIGQRPKFLTLYAVPQGFTGLSTKEPGLEIFASSGQVVLFGRHPKGFDYSWPRLSPLEVRPEKLPCIDGDVLNEVRQRFRTLPLPPPLRPKVRKRFARRMQRPMGAATGSVSSDRTSGCIATYAPHLRAVPVADRLAVAADIIAGAAIGTRYAVMTGIVFTLVVLGAEDAEIMSLLPVYLEHFEGEDSRNRELGFTGGLAWARRNLGLSRQQLLDDPLHARLRAGWKPLRAR